MDKFNAMEFKIFNLIRAGKSRNDIIAEKITTPGNIALILSGIYNKTNEIVNYRSARNKFEELACFLRNNPHAFGPIPVTEDIKASEEKAPEKAPEKKEVKPDSDNTTALKVKNAINRVDEKLNFEEKIISVKREILDQVYTEIGKELAW